MCAWCVELHIVLGCAFASPNLRNALRLLIATAGALHNALAVDDSLTDKVVLWTASPSSALVKSKALNSLDSGLVQFAHLPPAQRSWLRASHPYALALLS